MKDNLKKRVEILQVRVENQKEDMTRLSEKLDNISNAVDSVAEDLRINTDQGPTPPGESSVK